MESMGISPGPSMNPSANPENGFCHPGLLIHEVTRPPPRTMFTPGKILFRKPIIAKVLKAWLKKFTENPTTEGWALSNIWGSLFSKKEKKGLSSGLSAARIKSSDLRGDILGFS
jgi:hypothetical protein